MPSIRQELAETRSARWYQAVRGAQQRAAWSERVRCYDALRAVLAEYAAEAAGAPIELDGLVTLVARRAHFAGAEPVYRRFRPQHAGRPVARWAGPDPAIRPAAALVHEAKITAFWPYREKVIKLADALDMTPGEWAAAYLRAVASWACETRPLAACHPLGPPECVGEDLLVLAAVAAASPDPAAFPTEQAQPRAARLRELADGVVRAVLEDARLTPSAAADLVRDEARRLLAMPTASLADRLARTLAELSMRIGQAGDRDGLSADQAARLLTMTSDLTTLLSETASCPANQPGD